MTYLVQRLMSTTPRLLLWIALATTKVLFSVSESVCMGVCPWHQQPCVGGAPSRRWRSFASNLVPRPPSDSQQNCHFLFFLVVGEE